MRFGDDYAVVPDAVIRTLQAREDPVSGLHRLADAAPFARGAPVRISARPFAGLEGVFERYDGAKRVIVLLSLLGHGARVCVPIQFVAPSDAR